MYRLIIVEDDLFIREQLRDVFDWRSWGFEVTGCFPCAQEAMEYIRANPMDVLFSDIRLGGDTGLELAKQTLELRPQAEVVLISAYSEFQYAHAAIQLSVFDYLNKPVTYEAVSDCFLRLRRKLDGLSERPGSIMHYIKRSVDSMDLANADSLIKMCLRDNKDSAGSVRAFFLQLYNSLSQVQDESGEPEADAWAEIRRRIEKTEDIPGFTQIQIDLLQLYKRSANHEYHYHQVEMAKTYITENYRKDIHLEQVAEFVSMNPVYFSRYFKKHTNERFIDYLSRVRVEKAKELLTGTEKKVYEICHLVGYNSKFHFYKIFKQFTGLTPAEYKNRLPRTGKAGNP